MDPLPLIALVGLGVAGLAVGSFLNLVIVRMPDAEPLGGAWRCVDCDAPIRPLDAVPVLSWVLLRGRCRSCGTEIPIAYPLVELANAALWVIAGLRFGPSWALLPMLLLFSTLLAQSVIDLELYRLLDKITFPVLGVSVVLLTLVSAVEGDVGRILPALLGGVAYFAFLLLVGLLPIGRGRGGPMGLGDAKLALLLGLYAAWLHPVLVFFSVFIGNAIGVLVGLVVIAVRRSNAHYPFGPWLVLGCLISIVWARSLLDRYHIELPAFLAGPGTF